MNEFLNHVMSILGIIPARGGSKSISMKNIVNLSGLPLISYTIKAALNSKINRVIVSTDSKKISEISSKFGAEVPFLRPKKFASSSSHPNQVIEHALNFLEKNESYVPEIVLFLQPTSPHRTSEMINKSIQLLQNSKASSVVSVTKPDKHPFQSYVIKNGFLKAFYKNKEKKYYQRQLLPDFYNPTGAIYTFWTKTFKKYNSIYGPKPKPMIINNEILNIDIDFEFDLFLSEMIFKNWSKFKKSYNHILDK